MQLQYQRLLKFSHTFTAEEDLLAISQEELHPSTIGQPSTQGIAGWLQSPINSNQITPFQSKNGRQHVKLLLKQAPSSNTPANGQNKQQNRVYLKGKLDHYLNKDFSDPFNYQPPTSKQSPAKEDFVRGQRMKGFERKTLNFKSLHPHLRRKRTLTALSTGKSKTIEMSHTQKKGFRVSTKKRSGLSLINYPLQQEFGSEGEQQKMSLILKYYLKKNTLSQ